MRILCLDLETTGLNEQRSGIVEIGAVWLHSGEGFFRTCRPAANCVIEPRALEVNGWTEERLRSPSLMPESLAVSELLGWIHGSGEEGIVVEKVQLSGWNVHFDYRHLQAALDRANVEQQHRPFGHRLLDASAVMAADTLRKQLGPQGGFAGFFEETILSLNSSQVAPNCDEASALLGLEPEPRPHNALTGARWARTILLRLLASPL